MQQRPLGRAGLMVSRLALGTMTWGRDTDPDDAAAQLKTFVDAGGNLIDTADVYGDGDAEDGHRQPADHASVPRDDVLIATKAGLRPGRERRRDTSRGHLLRSAGRVAAPARHRPRRPLAGARVRPGHAAGGDAVRAGLRGHVRPGPVRRASPTSPAGRPRRRPPGRAPGPGGRRSSRAQVEYSLLERGIEREVLPACRRRSAWACCPGRRSAAAC